MDARPILIGFLVVGAFALAAMIGLLYAGFARGRARWLPIPFILMVVTAIPSIDGDVRLAAAFAVPMSVAAIVFFRPAAESAYAAGERVGIARAWGMVALLGGGLFAALVVDGMRSPSHVYPKSTFELEFGASETVAVRRITVSGGDLPSGTEIGPLRVSAVSFVGLERDRGDDLNCGSCDAHYLATFVRDTTGDPATMTVGLEASVDVPHRYANEIGVGDFVFEVETRDAAYDEVTVAESETIPLSGEQPFDVVRVSADIPAAAMVSTGLREWPGLWVVSEELTYPGTGLPAAQAFPYSFDALNGCEAGEDCEYRADALVRLPAGVASVEARLDVTGAIYYFDGTYPGAEVADGVQISRPLSWHIQTIGGQLTSDFATSYGVRQTVWLTGTDYREWPVIVGVTAYELASGDTVERTTKGTCSADRCWIELYVEAMGNPATPVPWTAQIHIGFFESEALMVDLEFDHVVVNEYQDDI